MNSHEAAERVLASATANVGVAISDLFPKLSLTGLLGLQNPIISKLLESNSEYWNAGAILNMPIFNEQKFAQIGIEDARQQQALIAYEIAILDALSDVEDSLMAFNQEQTRHILLAKTVAANQHAYELAKKLNDAGLIDFLNVLAAQQILFQSQTQLSQSEQALSLDLIAVYKSLGGGWENVDIKSL